MGGWLTGLTHAWRANQALNPHNIHTPQGRGTWHVLRSWRMCLFTHMNWVALGLAVQQQLTDCSVNKIAIVHSLSFSMRVRRRLRGVDLHMEEEKEKQKTQQLSCRCLANTLIRYQPRPYSYRRGELSDFTTIRNVQRCASSWCQPSKRKVTQPYTLLFKCVCLLTRCLSF